MKTIPVCLIVSGLLSSVTLCAQAPDGRQGEPAQKQDRPGHRRHFAEAWKSADKDADGFLTLEEFKAMPRIQNLPVEKQQRLFGRLDKNHDEKLAREELRRIGGPREGQGPPQRLWELDTDKSGGVSFEEFKKGRVFQKLPGEKQQAVFRRLDSDGDGQITPKDKPERPFMRRHGGGGWHGGGPNASKPGLRALLRQFDENGDGAVSFEEFRKSDENRQLAEDVQEDRFEALDRNHDGKLTEADMPARPQRDEVPSVTPPPQTTE